MANDRKLLGELERLRNELSIAIRENTEARAKLDRLIEAVEEAGGQPERGLNRDLLDEIRAAVQNFEVEHPRATAILNDIMVSLSNMGI